ncbi:MAG: DUF933 domain-containing protein [Candidatus Omnitrophica bacterium]|nr:DUF933 domain-containing protein [Candidatus Omnitrophota bacterium]
MKIFDLGLNIGAQKYKYKGEYFDKIVDKFKPQKTTNYTVEFIDDDMQIADAVCYQQSKKLDLVVADLDKIETRMQRSKDEKEKAVLSRFSQLLEKEVLLCDTEIKDGELEFLRTLPLVSLKPCLSRSEVSDLDALVGEVLDKAGIILFFTAGKKEVRAWSLKAGESILEAAGRIHSDLKRGFIKADVVNCKDLDNFFNMAEARSRGLAEVVDKDYIVKANDIIEIRFNV